jgi:hypothetical protein
MMKNPLAEPERGKVVNLLKGVYLILKPKKNSNGMAKRELFFSCRSFGLRVMRRRAGVES